ncbi:MULTISPECIES: DUF2017 domain-containing protein [Corynebacterium]|uniref:DUF2017 domain-containing protein n=1 Tax=Corynebacterium TaxID=1716 RepID=UPI00124E9463|nr:MULTISPECIES: DUF2017 domain-containing protein [Corynebacterium]
MESFKRKKGLMRSPKYTAVFEPLEREVLGNLTATVSEALIQRAQSAPKDELEELVGMTGGHKEAPKDPGLARLLPDFEREGDEEFEGDNSLLRSLHENDICRDKLRNLQVINSALGPDGGVNVTVDDSEVHAWLSGLNDLRLYIASSEMGNYEGAEEERDQLVEWLGFVQDSLLHAYMS